MKSGEIAEKLQNLKARLRIGEIELSDLKISARFGDLASITLLQSCKIEIQPIVISEDWINEIESHGVLVKMLAYLAVLSYTSRYGNQEDIEFLESTEAEIAHIIGHISKQSLTSYDFSEFQFDPRNPYFLEGQIQVTLMNFAGLGSKNYLGLKPQKLLEAIAHAMIQWHLEKKRLEDIDWLHYEIKPGLQIMYEWLKRAIGFSK